LLSKHEQRSREKDGREENASSVLARDADDAPGSAAVVRSTEDLLREFAAKVPSPYKETYEVRENEWAR